MQQDNIKVSRVEVVKLSEVNQGHSKYKDIRGTHNLTKVTTEEFLLDNGLPELARSIDCSGVERGLNFKEVDNDEIIKELSTFAKLCPEFLVDGVMEEESDEPGYHKDTLKITVKNSQVEVVIL